MSGAKETLGYDSRTETVHALRRRGLTTHEIAREIGIETKTVSALECSAGRLRSAANAPRQGASVFGSAPLGTRVLLRPHAAKRGISVEALMRQIIEQVAFGNLVDAVLDDEEAAH